MFRKLYKQRGYLYALIGILGFLFFSSRNNFNKKPLSSNNNANNLKNHDLYYDFVNNNSNLHHNHEHLEQNHVDEKKSVRITIDTYVSPPPCLDCPGENGTAIIILVRNLFLKKFLIFNFKLFLLLNKA